MNLDSPAGRAVVEAMRASAYPAAVPQSRVMVMLAVALAVRVPCETCGGTGHRSDCVSREGQQYSPVMSCCLGCADCDGSGSVPALRLLMEDEK